MRPPLSARDALSPIFYFGRQALVAFLLPLLLAIGAAVIAKPVYVAQSRLLVLMASDYIFSGEASGAGAGASLDRLQIVHAELEILGSRDLRMEALREIGPARVYGKVCAGKEGLIKAVERLDRDLMIDNLPQSNIIQLGLRNGDPVVAQQLLDRIVTLYIARRREVFSGADPNRLAPEQAELQARLAAAEAALSNFANAHGIGDYTQALAAVQAREAFLESPVGVASPGTPANPAWSVTGGRDAPASRQAIAQALVQTRARLAELVEIGPHYRALAQERTLAEASLQEFNKHVQDEQIDTALARAQANVRVIQPAAVTMSPHSGRTPLLVGGLIVGLIAAAATVAILHAFSDVMISPHDVEARLGLPTILAPPASRSRKGFPGDQHLSPQRLDQNDAYLILSLLSGANGLDHGLVELIAPGASDGASALTIDLALLAAARTDLRVLVMDLEPPPGQEVITQLMKRGAVFTADTPASGISRFGDTSLYVSQPIGVNGWRLTENDWMRCVAYARENFGLVIIQAPALDVSYTGVAAACQADLVLVVVEAEKTRVGAAVNLLERLAAVGAKVGGVVLNGRRYHIPRALYDRL